MVSKDPIARLKRCMEMAALTVADLAHFLQRPHPTVRSWLVKGAVPHHKRERFLADLAKLEKLVKSKGSNLVPFSVPFFERPAYLAALNGHRLAPNTDRAKAKRAKPKRARKAASPKRRKSARTKAGKGSRASNRHAGENTAPAAAG